MPKNDADPMQTYRRVRFHLGLFVVVNLITWLLFGLEILVWWPMLGAVYHMGRAEGASS
jgi:hypothetical protein